MDQDRLDQLFKDSLYDHKTEIDKDQLWAAINKTQRRKAGWLNSLKLLSLIAIVGIVVSLYLSNLNSDSGLSSEYVAKQNTRVTKNIEAQPETSKGISEVPEEKFNNNINQITTTRKNSDYSKTTLKGNKNKTLSQSTNINSTSSIKKIRKTNSANTTNSSEQETVTTSLINKPLSVKQKTIAARATKTIKQNSAGQTKLPAIAQKSTLNSIASIAINEPAYLDYQRPAIGRNDKIQCYDHRKKIHPLYAEIYSSVDYVTNRFSATSENLEYKEERDATQTQLEGYRAGLRLKFLTRSGLYFKTGIELSAIRERFDRKETIERTEIRPNQLLEVITQSDTTIYIYGDAPVQIQENKIWKVWNTYRTLGIPLLIGYQSEYGKFTYGIDLGGIYNLHYDFEGMLLDSSFTPVAQPDYFKSRISSSLTGGLNIGYNLTDRLGVMAYTSFKHNLSNINQSNNKVQQANTRIGLGLALQFRL